MQIAPNTIIISEVGSGATVMPMIVSDLSSSVGLTEFESESKKELSDHWMFPEITSNTLTSPF